MKLPRAWECYLELDQQARTQTALPEDGNPLGALVLTKLIEWYRRFEVGQFFFVSFVCA